MEFKAVGGNMGPSEEQQIKTYMKVLKIKAGLLINFQQPKKEGKFQLKTKEVNIQRGRAFREVRHLLLIIFAPA